MVSLEFFIDI